MDDWQAHEIVLTPKVPLWDGEWVRFEYQKFNPFHDELGRFAEGPGGGGNTISADIAQATGGGPVGDIFGPKPIDPNKDLEGWLGQVIPMSKPTATGGGSGYQITPNGPTHYVVTQQGKYVGEFSDLAAANNYVNNLATPVAPNYPLPQGYAIDAIPDESTGIVDYAVSQEGHGVIGQFNTHDAAQQFAVEHAASQPDTTGQFHLSADQLPPSYQVNPNIHGNGYVVVAENGVAHAEGSDAKQAVTEYFNSHPNDALPEGYKYVAEAYSNTIFDNHGVAVWVANGNLSAVETVENFLNSTKAPTDFVTNAGAIVDLTAITAKPALGTAAQTLGQFHLSSYNLPAGYTVQPDKEGGGYQVMNAEGLSVVHGIDVSSTVNSYFNGHPQDAMPEGYTWVSGNVLDPKGSVVYSQIDPTQSTAQAINEFLNGPKAPGEFQIGAGTHVQDMASQPSLSLDPSGATVYTPPGKTSATAANLPAGYKVEAVSTDTNPFPFQVTNTKGGAASYGNTEQEALSNYFQEHEVSSTPAKFVPGVENLPKDGTHLNEHAGGYSPVKVIGPGGEVLGAGDTKEEALHEYFTYHANAMLPAGYQIGYDHITDTPTILDAKGTEVYSGKAGTSGYDAAINWLSANPSLLSTATPSGVPFGYKVESNGANFSVWHLGLVVGQFSNEADAKNFANEHALSTSVVAAHTPAAPVVHAPGPTEADLPAGVHLVNITPNEIGGVEFKIYDQSGHSVGGYTRDQALQNYFTGHPEALLPAGYKLDDSQSDQAFHIIGPNGLEVYVGHDDLVQTIQDFKAQGSDTASLANVGETYFGPGRPALEQLGVNAGLPPGFNVYGRTRGDTSPLVEGETAPPSQHQFTADEKQTIYSYTGSGNSAINKFLRDDIRPDSPSYVAQRIADLDHIFADTSTAKAMTLYRGISEKAQAKLDYAIAHTDGHFVDKGFLSTSSSEQVAADWKSGTYLTIDVPKGSKFIDVEHPKMTSHTGEHEWIGARNQHFVVTKRETSHFGYGNRSNYFVRLVNIGNKPKDTRQMDLPFIDHGPVNKQDEPYDPSEKFTWEEGDIVPTPPEDFDKYNEVHDPKTGEFASGPGSAAYAERAARFMQRLKGELELGIEGSNPNAGVRQIGQTPLVHDDQTPYLPMVMPISPVSGPLVFHGTSQEALASIDANGLVARGGAGADQWAQEHPEFFSPGGSDPGVGATMVTKFADKPANLFVATNPETAFRYATFTAKMTGSTPVVIPVHLSRSVAQKLAWDAAGNAGEMKLDGEVHILKEWLGKPVVGSDGMAKMLTDYYRMPTSVKLPVDFTAGTPAQVLANVEPTAARDVMGKSGDVVVYLVFFVEGVPHDGAVKRKGQGFLVEGQGFLDVEKFNPWHDLMGLFASGPSGDAPHMTSAAGSEAAINELINPHVMEAQREAVSDYTDEGYWDVNNYLRNRETPAFPTSTDSIIKHLDSLLNTASLPEEQTVYRGISKSGAARMDEAIASGNTTFVDKGFVSTTRDQHYASVFAASLKHNHATVDIVLPKGSKALDIASWSSSPDEQETLIQRGAAFKITGKTINNDTNAAIYHVRLLPGQEQLDLPFGKQTHMSNVDKFVWTSGDLAFMTEEQLHKYNEVHDPKTGEFASASTNEMDSAEPSGQRGDSRFTASRPLTKEERLGVGFYTATTGYREINAALRSGFSMANTPETQAHADNLAKAIDAHTVNEPITVFRGIRNDDLVKHFDQALASGNDEFTDKGFPSTSFSEVVAKDFSTHGFSERTAYIMRIVVPKGAHALPASAERLGALDEQEVVLQHGSRFKLDGRRLDLSHDDGERVIYDAHLVT